MDGLNGGSPSFWLEGRVTQGRNEGVQSAVLWAGAPGRHHMLGPDSQRRRGVDPGAGLACRKQEARRPRPPHSPVESQWETLSKYSSLVTRSNRQRQVCATTPTPRSPRGTRGWA